MQAPENLTDFAVACLPTMSLDARPLAVLIIAGTYALPPPGARDTAPTLLDDQPEVPLAPTHHGDPSRSSLIWEGQAIPGRPSTDIYVDAQAWTPGGRPASSTMVGIRVGQTTHSALVFGDRRWRVGGLASRPEEFGAGRGLLSVSQKLDSGVWLGHTRPRLTPRLLARQPLGRSGIAVPAFCFG